MQTLSEFNKMHFTVGIDQPLNGPILPIRGKISVIDIATCDGFFSQLAVEEGIFLNLFCEFFFNVVRGDVLIEHLMWASSRYVR